MARANRAAGEDLEADLRRAVEREEFSLEYQPILDLQTGVIAAVEALLRWRHPLRGTIPVGDYLGLAEDTGLIVPIGARVFRLALRQLRTWQLGFARTQALVMSLNVTDRQLTDPETAGVLEASLNEAEIEGSAVVVEIAAGGTAPTRGDGRAGGARGERAGDAAVRETLERLRALGIRIAIDDFGSGSSLHDLRSLPVDVVKVDPTFVGLAAGPDRDAVFADALLMVAQARELQAVGKGVETREQARRLASMGYALAQGYYYSKPLGPEGIGTILARGRNIVFPR